MTKLKFKRLMRKKWLYPALYLTVAALVLVGVFWYQQSSNDVGNKIAEQPQSDVQDDVVTQDHDSQVVMNQNENLDLPVADEQAASIVTKFYDYGASKEDQESALVLYNNKYYQSEGVDYTKEDGSTFDVAAALSGTVTEVKEDPLYGNVVEITHDDDVTTVYASLDEVSVEAGSEVIQGDVLGKAGTNSFGQASGVHVHFEVRNEGKPVNPEKFFGQPISKIKEEAAKQDEAVKEEAAPNATTEEQPTQDQQITDDPAQGTNSADEDADAGNESEPGEEDGQSTDDELAPDDEQQAPSEDSASSLPSTQA
ncbi:M23 family metallopeptidase [Halobacillus salinarum]|uniref:M23 family metallopeptidase n=1 Tax=Halobacillus salinarum TaxID=2932257 RepID=A0ABY4EMH3_9BACI|nr:M23 family metallopeptidase [Halobacillus salinarum]UOQ45364.1 M23 family metallopeptidase [Halobacillus salinarum]